MGMFDKEMRSALLLEIEIYSARAKVESSGRGRMAGLLRYPLVRGFITCDIQLEVLLLILYNIPTYNAGFTQKH
jgi:hypothetical protein